MVDMDLTDEADGQIMVRQAHHDHLEPTAITPGSSMDHPEPVEG